MSPITDLAASLIEAGAAGYGSAAASRLLETRSEAGSRFGDRAFPTWKDHLSLRLRELASALLVSEPGLFVDDVVWSRASFAAREVPLEDLQASLECLREVLAEELPEGSAEEPRNYLTQAIEALSRQPPTDDGGASPDPAEEKLALTYLEAALSGDRRRAIDALVAAVDNGLTADAAYQRVLTMAQGRVGDMWHRWEISVPQEHFVTATTRAAMAILARRFEARPPNGKTVVVSVVPGNGHELAAQALADYFEMDGWRAIHLGGAMPAADLALGAEVFEADLLALSLALSTHVRGAMEVVRRVRAQRPATKILLGGAVVSRTPDLWQRLGGDGFAAGYGDALRVAADLTS